MADVNWNLAVTPDPFKQIAEGRDYSRSVFDQAALLKAGSQYAAGDPASAANTVASRGDFEKAGKLQDLGTARTAGAQYAAGDYAGAGKTFAMAGNINEAGKLRDQQAKQFILQHNTMKQVVPYLQDAITQGHDPVEAFKLIIPKLKAVGTTDDAITQAQQFLASNPQQALAAFNAMGNINPEFKEAGGVLYVFDKNNPTKPIAKLGDTGAFRGNDLIAQAWNIVLDPNADRNSPKFHAAVTELQRSENRYDPNTNTVTETRPRDLSWLQQQGAQPSNTGAAPAGGTPTPAAPVSDDPLPPGVTSRVAPINPPPPPTRRIDRPQAPAETPPTLGAPAPAAATPAVPPQAGPAPGTAPPQQGRTTIYQSPNMTVTRLPPNDASEGRERLIEAHVAAVLANTENVNNIDKGLRDAVVQGVYEIQAADPTRVTPRVAALIQRVASQMTKPYTDSAQYKLAVDGLPYIERIKSGLSKPGSIGDAEALDGLVKLANSGNAITEAQIKLITGSGSWADWLGQLRNRFENGGVLSDNQRRQIKDISDTTFDAYEKGTQPLYEEVADKLKTAHIPPQYWSILNVRDMSRKVRAALDETSPPQGQSQRGPYAPGKGQPFIPKPSIDALRQHPQRAAEFDKKYGAGAAASVLGR